MAVNGLIYVSNQKSQKKKHDKYMTVDWKEIFQYTI